MSAPAHPLFDSLRRAFRGRVASRLFLAVFYLTLGVSAAWHAPHFSRGDIAIGTDRHESHEAVGSEACALCSVKNAPHQAAATVLPFWGTRFSAFESAVFASRFEAPFAAFLARGPPSRLS